MGQTTTGKWDRLQQGSGTDYNREVEQTTTGKWDRLQQGSGTDYNREVRQTTTGKWDRLQQGSGTDYNRKSRLWNNTSNKICLGTFAFMLLTKDVKIVPKKSSYFCFIKI